MNIDPSILLGLRPRMMAVAYRMFGGHFFSALVASSTTNNESGNGTLKSKW